MHHSTYLDVPKRWLGEEFFIAAEKLKERNEMLYRHEYLGEVTGTGGAVFQNVQAVPITDAQILTFDRQLYGLDFGLIIKVTLAVMPSIKFGERVNARCAA